MTTLVHGCIHRVWIRPFWLKTLANEKKNTETSRTRWQRMKILLLFWMYLPSPHIPPVSRCSNSSNMWYRSHASISFHYTFVSECHFYSHIKFTIHIWLHFTKWKYKKIKNNWLFICTIYTYLSLLLLFISKWLGKTGVLLTYHIIVRGLDISMNKSRVLTNVTIDATTPTLLLANLTEGVTYTVSVAAGNRAGQGPYSAPATLRLDPITKRLDQTASHRFVHKLYLLYYTLNKYE